MILAIDTSAGQCAVALDGVRRCERMTRGHAERLFPMIGEAMAGAGADWQAITRIAVCTGPGSFTGIRVGVAAARGLALSLGVPAIGVTRFEALALAAARAARFVWEPEDIRILGAADAPRPATGGARVVAVAIAARGGSYRQDFPRTWPDEGAPGEMRFEPGDPPAPPPAGSILAGDGWAEGALGPPDADPCVLARLAADRSPGAPPAPCYLRPPDAAPPREAPPAILDP